MSQKVKFSTAPGSNFYATIRNRVDQFFVHHWLSRYANGHIWGKIAFFLTGFAGLYLVILIEVLPAWTALPLAAALGMFSAFVGFNVCHGSLSGSNQVNKLFGA